MTSEAPVASRRPGLYICGVTPSDEALVELGRHLRETGYRFVTPTPETHRRVNARPGNEEARSLRDVLGWSRPFRRALLPSTLLALSTLPCARAVAGAGSPAERGPFLTGGRRALRHSPTRRSRRIGLPRTRTPTGSSPCCAAPWTARPRGGRGLRHGRGRPVAPRSRRSGWCSRRERAGDPARRVNAALAGAGPAVELARSDVLAGVSGPIDLVVANPPYLVDDARRAYRDGGGAHGIASPSGSPRGALSGSRRAARVVLYTATPIVEGRTRARGHSPPVLGGATEVGYGSSTRTSSGRSSSARRTPARSGSRSWR